VALTLPNPVSFGHHKIINLGTVNFGYNKIVILGSEVIGLGYFWRWTSLKVSPIREHLSLEER
jgi:hypothetical protein